MLLCEASAVAPRLPAIMAKLDLDAVVRHFDVDEGRVRMPSTTTLVTGEGLRTALLH